ncbi:6796_t:CDS:1 [Ambispora leptoticha]|uniref:6796_t:CDS:1 n=1 Tax=Ambispora leptoticha TaxID=144679 RepID=A0A9N9EQ62_9GLOM|nr:6796_t:CDS:1 [Ambispora leptoticha]
MIRPLIYNKKLNKNDCSDNEVHNNNTNKNDTINNVNKKYISESVETASIGNLAGFTYFHALSYAKIRIYYQEENLRNQVLISSLVNRHIKARNERLVRQRARQQQLHEEIIETTGLLTAIAKSIEIRLARLRIN